LNDYGGSVFSIRSWAVIQSCSSTCSGSFAPGGLHHDLPEWSRDELIRAIHPQTDLRLPFRRICDRGHLLYWFLFLGHHMFTSGQSIIRRAGVFFPQLHGCRAVSHQSVYWTPTLYRGSISFATPMIYALGFIGLFTMGGLTGLFWQRRA